MRILYTWLFRAAVPFILLRLWWRGRAQPQYRRRWRERFGQIPARASRAPMLWVHAVSVGETLAAVPMIRELAKRHPDWQWLVTTTTPTGSDQVRAALAPLLGGRLLHYYAPYDLPECIAPFIDRLHPRALVIMETELWPNLLAQCAARGIPTLLANARLSEKSAAGYARFGLLAGPMLKNLDKVVAQYPADAERFIGLGLPRDRVLASGNIKFDLHIGRGLASEAQALAHQWRGAGGRRVWLAASTHAGEEEIVLDAYRQLLGEFPDLLLVLVPRHPQRFDGVAQLCRSRQLNLQRRSDGGRPGPQQQVLLGDTMGELLRFYGASDLAFVGGSLVPVGGHNMIEPAAWGLPIVSGPQLHNFATVAQLLRDAGGLQIVENAQQLAAQLAEWLRDKDARRSAGVRARQVAAENSGALARLVSEIENLLGTL